MSCLEPGYNPNPTYVGYRVENRCAYDGEFPYSQTSEVFINQLRNNFPIASVPYINDMLRKGNILQYKANSSNLTKKQKYSQIAKGMWVNRNTTWATQNQTYTNPNTNYLKRVGSTNITLTGSPTNLPITCTNNPETLTPQTTVIQDGGTLLCNSIEIPCTKFSQTFPSKICYPTSDSNVPGPIIQLCYTNRLPTYYPRRKLTMNTSLSKWPQNAKLLCKSGNALTPFNCPLLPNE
jgi:hypothetical protein